MRKIRAPIVSLIIFFTLLTTSFAEPLRLLVPPFEGPEPLSKHIRTTIYVELIKAFQHSSTTQKGAWILYGLDPMNQASHQAAIDAASWPSVRADLTIWGQVRDFPDGVVVQLYLTITPILLDRSIRPEKWEIHFKNNHGTRETTLEMNLPGLYYEFEPFILPNEVIYQFEYPQGIPLYSKRSGGEKIGRLEELMRFYEVYDDAILVQSGGLSGWLRSADLSKLDSEAMDFIKGAIRLMRGDWRGAENSFNKLLSNKKVTQNLRIQTLIYIGIAREKSGKDGSKQFQQAYNLNKLDRTSAAYLLMSRVALLKRAQQLPSGDSFNESMRLLKKDYNKVKGLFPKNDAWLVKIASLIQ